MFPFIFAFILAIGIPFLPSSLYRALHFPSLRSNFLPASYAPERSLDPSSERSLLLENGYLRDISDSGHSSQFLVFTSPNYSDHQVDSEMLAYMSFTEKLELTYPQTSIWLVICAPLLYKFVEAMVLTTLSFLFASAFFSRRSLPTLVERFCTAHLIYWHYTPKAALSSFLPDVLLCVHKYWMDNSVTSDQASTTPANISQHVLLGVLADGILSTATISEDIGLVATKEANSLVEHSSSVALITPPRSRETSAPPEPALKPLGQPVDSLTTTSEQGTQVEPILLPICEPCMSVGSHPLGSTTKLFQHEQSSAVLGNRVEHHLLRSTSSSSTTRAKNHSTGVSASNSKAITNEVPAPLNHNSTPSFVTISLEDMYRAKKPGSTSISHSPPHGDGLENTAPDAISSSSLDLGSIANVNSSPSKPEPDEIQAEGLRPSSSERSHSGRRRYKSDGIQVRSARCHLGDPAAPPDPATVNGTCVFWKSSVGNGEKGGRAPEERALAPGFHSGSPSLERNSRSMPDRAVAAGSADAVPAGMVLTPEGAILVPASQRADGSMRKEVKVRPGHFLREPLAEKYCPPTARLRTSTWDPRLRELLATPLSSPSACNSSSPFTPESVHQRFFGRQYNSPASLTNNWRRSGSTLTPPPPVKKLPAPEFSTPSQTMAIVSSRAFDNRSSFDEPGDQILSRPSDLERVQKVILPASDGSAEQTESNKTVHAVAKVANSVASSNADKENRLPLRDITPLSEVVDRLNPPSTPTVLASTTAKTFASLQVAKVIQRELEPPSRTPVTEPRETLFPSPHRKRKPSEEPHTPCVVVKSTMLSPSESPSPASYRRPRSRRSTPHLGKLASGKRQVTAQTPESSAKRRRMRTASARGMENITLAVAAAATAVDRNGQIVLPAGTGWKGRSLNSLIPSQLPVAQRQRQPITLASDVVAT